MCHGPERLRTRRERWLGFDVRAGWLTNRWPRDRRRQYLLREDVRKPLSVDPWVWPAAYEGGEALGDHHVPGFDTGLAPPDEHAPLELWPSPKAARDAIAACVPDERYPLHIIGISVLTPESDGSRMPDGAGTPAFLGYDVADASRLSGLMNCGYSPADKENLGVWRSALNEHHLFGEAETARAFAEVTDARVREHAPFFVYGIYRFDF